MKHFIKHFANATLIGILLYVVFLAIYFFNGRTIEVNGAFWKEILEHMIFSWLIYLANAVLIAYLIHRYGMRIFKGNILFLSCLGNIAISVIAIFLARIIVISGLQGLAFSEFISGESPQYYIVSLVIAVCITGIFYSVFYYKHRQDTKVKEQKIIAGTASAQFDALKNQLD
ncbi:MAG: histidine kinase, partial [Robiginitalea sp.]